MKTNFKDSNRRLAFRPFLWPSNWPRQSLRRSTFQTNSFYNHFGRSGWENIQITPFLYLVLGLLFHHSEVLLLISIVLLQKPLNFDINYNKFDFHKKSILRVITGVGESLDYLILLKFTSSIFLTLFIAKLKCLRTVLWVPGTNFDAFIYSCFACVKTIFENQLLDALNWV